MSTHELCTHRVYPMRLICVRSEFNYPATKYSTHIRTDQFGFGTRNCAAFYPVLKQNVYQEVVKCYPREERF